MFRIPLDWAITLYVSAALLLVLILWVFYNYRETNKQEAEPDLDKLVICEYCGHLFYNHLEQDILNCPMCNSYVSTEPSRSSGKKTRKRQNAPDKSK